MTTGRFESRVHTQGGPLEGRLHWSTYKRELTFPFRKVSEETQYKESCPFHDLRAEGQFQPETWGIGDPGQAPKPDMLLRPPGGRLNCSLARHEHTGCGGGSIPLDTTPQPPKPLPGSDKPWTGRPGGRGLFMPIPFQPEGPPLKPHPKARPAPPRPFQAGKTPPPFAPYPHMHEHRQEPKAKPPMRLQCGRGPGVFDPDISRGPRAVTAPPETRAKPLPPVPVGKTTTNLRGTLQGTFGRYPESMSDPYDRIGDDRGKIRKKLKPIYTWACRTKRSMPISAPWVVTKGAPDG
eukprot:TRINITY_DN2945_c0_g2_i1.p1 TRINITY_DN2945_c0_g2~~TRINITY_DN2945_c0_g2_i1.p1  ORF type:complete len:337 (+),score=45.22 TRINITY_DN2945_c0_g2_i1:133-1011(+)